MTCSLSWSVVAVACDDGLLLLITHHIMILVIIAVLIIDTIPLTRAVVTTATVVKGETQLMMTQGKYHYVVSSILLFTYNCRAASVHRN